jgi:hypothetical protein
LGTNEEFLGRFSHPGFLGEDYTTGFIEMKPGYLFKAVDEGSEETALQIYRHF